MIKEEIITRHEIKLITESNLENKILNRMIQRKIQQRKRIGKKRLWITVSNNTNQIS
jgi:hypothetical protein